MVTVPTKAIKGRLNLATCFNRAALICYIGLWSPTPLVYNVLTSGRGRLIARNVAQWRTAERFVKNFSIINMGSADFEVTVVCLRWRSALSAAREWLVDSTLLNVTTAQNGVIARAKMVSQTFLLTTVKGAKRPLRGGETSRGRNVQGAKRPGCETYRWRNVQGANWKRGETSSYRLANTIVY